jgi:hypothetical protein
LGIEQDSDITTKDSADLAVVEAYNNLIDGADEPDVSALKLDMLGNTYSLWNKRIVELLVQKFDVEDENENEWGLPSRLNFYIQDIIKKQLRRFRMLWRCGQCQLKENGEMETENEWEERQWERQLERLKDARHLTRHQNVSGEIGSAEPS